MTRSEPRGAMPTIDEDLALPAAARLDNGRLLVTREPADGDTIVIALLL